MTISPLHMRRHLCAGLRTLLASLAALVVLAGAVASVALAAAPPAGAANWAPVHAGDFPDPSVMEWLGTYYGFATQNFAAPSQTINIQVSTSSNGIDWSQQSGVDALPTVGSWAKSGNTWAPSVVRNDADNDFVMYYTATEIQTGDQCIGVATSLLPEGPYTDNSAQPMVCQNGVGYSDPTVDSTADFGGSIDPDIFTDSSGNNWLIWKSDGNHMNPPVPTTLWSIPLGSDFMLTGNAQPTPLLTDDAAWQSGIIEGPDMVETSTTTGNTTTNNYTLFYSGSDEGASTYAIGWASCPSGPAAACTDESTSAPLLTTSSGMSGPGGPDVYDLPAVGSASPQLVMAFAAWQGSTIGYLGCGIRPMYLADLNFEPNGSGPPVPDAVAGQPRRGSRGKPVVPRSRPSRRLDTGKSDPTAASSASAAPSSTARPAPCTSTSPWSAWRRRPTATATGWWPATAACSPTATRSSTARPGSITLNKPIIGMIPTLDGGGYWLIASDGGVFAFGDAKFYGSTASDNLAYPVTAAAPSFLAGGYWLVDADGQVFNFGDAPNEGQPAYAPGGYRITGMAGTQSANGYWLASANGNVADFGDAAPYGSMAGTTLNAPVVGMAANSDDTGYWLQGADGGIFTFGNAEFYGSMGGRHLNAPMVGIAAT